VITAISLPLLLAIVDHTSDEDYGEVTGAERFEGGLSNQHLGTDANNRHENLERSAASV
jgi:hypothetical protein